jgi:hypothetical protein
LSKSASDNDSDCPDGGSTACGGTWDTDSDQDDPQAAGNDFELEFIKSFIQVILSSYLSEG